MCNGIEEIGSANLFDVSIDPKISPKVSLSGVVCRAYLRNTNDFMYNFSQIFELRNFDFCQSKNRIFKNLFELCENVNLKTEFSKKFIQFN